MAWLIDRVWLLISRFLFSKIPQYSVRIPPDDTETTVDSENAQYFVQDFLSGRRNRPQSDPFLQELYDAALENRLSADHLAEVTRNHGTDLALLLLHAQIENRPENKRIQQVSDHFRELENWEPPQSSDYPHIAIVPGWMYEKLPDTGADLREQRTILEELGIDHTFVETEDDSSVEDNAAIVDQVVTKLATNSKPLLVLSCSKGGSETALAIGRMERRGSLAIRGWWNVSGIILGTPIADRLDHWSIRWYAKRVFVRNGWGKNWESVSSMCRERSRQRFREIRFPESLPIVNHVALPLSGLVTPEGFEGYRWTRDLGPTDTTSLITDQLIPNSATLSEFGLDHRLRSPNMRKNFVASLFAVLWYCDLLPPKVTKQFSILSQQHRCDPQQEN